MNENNVRNEWRGVSLIHTEEAKTKFRVHLCFTAVYYATPVRSRPVAFIPVRIPIRSTPPRPAPPPEPLFLAHSRGTLRRAKVSENKSTFRAKVCISHFESFFFLDVRAHLAANTVYCIALLRVHSRRTRFRIYLSRREGGGEAGPIDASKPKAGHRHKDRTLLRFKRDPLVVVHLQCY